MSEREPEAWTIHHHRDVDSTQSEARRRLAAGESLHRAAITADAQRAGIGRFGRPFASPEGGAWQTLVLADPQRALSDGRLAPALAVQIAERLARLDRPVGLKWPNDVLRGGAKCGGILIERVREHLLVGVGLNARNAPPPGFARLDLPPRAVWDVVREALDAATASWPPRDLPERWGRYDLLRGRVVRIGEGARAARGRVVGIAADGALRIVDARNQEHAIRAGSVADVDPPIAAGDGEARGDA